MSAIVNWIKKRGAKSGLNQTNSNIRMAGVIVGPFMLGWIAAQILFPQYRNISSGVVFALWIVGLVIYYSTLKAKAAGYMPFPQSHWFFPDGQQISFDLLISPAPNGYKEIGPKEGYSDGSHLYRVLLKDKLEVGNQDRLYPDIFNVAIWKTPAEWNESFKRTSHGEFFFENLFVDHPACENIALSVVYWDERGSTRIPVCVVTSCSYFHCKTYEAKGKEILTPQEMKEKEQLEATNADLKQKNVEVTMHSDYIEKELEVYASKSPKDVRKLIESGVNQSRQEVIDIMNTKESIWTRLINGKTLGYILIGLAITLILMHFFVGWPG